MFGFLKKALKKSVKEISKDEPKGLKKLTTKTLSEKQVEEFFAKNELELLQANIAVEAIDFLKDELKKRVSGKTVRRGEVERFVKNAFKEILLEMLNKEQPDVKKIITNTRKEGRPACFVFMGFNGSGKTTTIAKVAEYLKSQGFRPVLVASDTFRAASIEQIEHHAKKLGLKVVKHKYGADAAAVIFDAMKHAKSKGYDVVLADTAGRVHTDRNLMDELKKIVRVNKPDLKILVIDSLTGNDAVEQAKTFQAAVGIDCVVMTKTDVNEKGGSILSVCYATGKPILFLGTGQGYKDLKKFEPSRFVEELLG